jgi:hypothetical protein
MKEITIKVKFDYGEEVYFAFPGDSYRGIVTSLEVRGKFVTYQVTWEDKSVGYHTDVELTNTPIF